jgi:hypothetical protein
MIAIASDSISDPPMADECWPAYGELEVHVYTISHRSLHLFYLENFIDAAATIPHTQL